MSARARAALVGKRTVPSRVLAALAPARSALVTLRSRLRRRLLSEAARLTLAWSVAAVVGLAVIVPLSGPVHAAGGSATTLPLVLILLIVMLSASSLGLAGMTLWVMRDLPRRRLVAAARLPRPWSRRGSGRC